MLFGRDDRSRNRCPGRCGLGAEFRRAAPGLDDRRCQKAWLLGGNYDFDAQGLARFSDKRWPEWARPFWIRGRAAYVDMRSDGDIEDYRVIVNHEWKF
jgi:hypothetical protein